MSRKKESDKNTRILPEDEFLASPVKIQCTQILSESQDLFFLTRILYRKNGKRLLIDNQEKQELGKNVDLCDLWEIIYTYA